MTGQTPPPGAALRPGLEVLDLMGWGHTRATAARLLHIGDNAASKRLTRLYQALGARNGCHAIALAYRAGLLPLDPPGGSSWPTHTSGSATGSPPAPGRCRWCR